MTWNNDMDAAPVDRPIQARIPGYGDDNIIEWHPNLLDSDGKDCGGWSYIDGPECPECWHDGICWEINERGDRSVHPTHWKDTSHD
jgi:hypothetical protein